MALIQIKRGNSANVPGMTLAQGEIAVALDTGKLYVGDGVSNLLINPDISPVSEAAVKLETARQLDISGAEFVSTAASFDGSADVAIGLQLATSGVVAGTYAKMTVNDKGIVTAGSSLIVDDIPLLPIAKVDGLGDVVTLNTGTAAGNIPVLDANGKLLTQVMPELSIITTSVVATEVEMLALVAQQGDVAIRTDLEKTFILAGDDPTIVGNWVEMLSPTDNVLSVNGYTGAVTLTAADVGLGNVTNESKATMFTSPVFTGTPTAPTAATGDDSTQIATTAFVKAQQYLVASSTIDGGTF